MTSLHVYPLICLYRPILQRSVCLLVGKTNTTENTNKQIKRKNYLKIQVCNFFPYPLKCIYVIVLIILRYKQITSESSKGSCKKL